MALKIQHWFFIRRHQQQENAQITDTTVIEFEESEASDTSSDLGSFPDAPLKRAQLESL